MKIHKLILNDTEYLLTDKQAQQVLKVLDGRIDQLENDYKELKDCLTWHVVE